jgi:hypothetical protein
MIPHPEGREKCYRINMLKGNSISIFTVRRNYGREHVLAWVREEVHP